MEATAAAALEAMTIDSLVDAHRLAMTAGRGATISVRAIRVEHAAVLEAFIREQVDHKGWIVVGRGMQNLNALAQIHSLLTQAIDAHLPLLRVHLDDRAYVDAFGALSTRIRTVVFDKKHSEDWVLSKLDNIEFYLKVLRTGTAKLPLDDDDDAGAHLNVNADAKPESEDVMVVPLTCGCLTMVFSNQKVEPVVKDEMPEVAKPSAVESQ
ncbi:hypothetical protein U9M48_041199 [Paspalum notatum var. saurae]|uniref:Uncharacterized protein n=1 Tax=Paspalum notatum var. saurae TaxID=547442 RepID=A0AAQ3UMP6_PASNO